MSERNHVQRAANNDKSRNKASHYREEWSVDEDAFLQEMWLVEPEADVAEVLGRTIEACRQRFYVVRRGEAKATIHVKVSKTTTTVTEYRGVLDDPDDQWWSPAYYTDGK